MSLYTDLGVSADATTEQIRQAYKRAAQKHHPDKDGGDKETFQALQRAHSVLTDPERRKRYDETGATDYQPSAEDRVRASLITLLMSAAEGIDPAGSDLVARARQAITGRLMELEKAVKGGEDKAKRLRTVAERLTRNGGQNFVAEAFEMQAREHERIVEGIRAQIAETKLVEAELGEYSYRYEKNADGARMFQYSQAFNPNRW